MEQILPTPEIVNNVVLYTALFDVDNQDQALLNGMTAQVFFVTSAARDVLTIPVAALRNLTPIAASQTQRANVTVMRNGKAEEREVVVGISSRVAAEVLSGLQEGDQVVAGVVQNNKASAPAGGSSMRGFR